MAIHPVSRLRYWVAVVKIKLAILLVITVIGQDIILRYTLYPCAVLFKKNYNHYIPLPLPLTLDFMKTTGFEGPSEKPAGIGVPVCKGCIPMKHVTEGSYQTSANETI